MSIEHLKLSSYIKKVHQELRKNTELYGVEKAWALHCNNEDMLTEYAKCMKKLANEHWDRRHENDIKKSRNTWIVFHINEYFNKDNLLIKRNKDLMDNEKNILNRKIKITETFNEPYDILDVGSCYNPFKMYKNMNVIPIDISPASTDVYKCDFLNIKINDLNENEIKLLNTVSSNNNELNKEIDDISDKIINQQKQSNTIIAEDIKVIYDKNAIINENTLKNSCNKTHSNTINEITNAIKNENKLKNSCNEIINKTHSNTINEMGDVSNEIINRKHSNTINEMEDVSNEIIDKKHPNTINEMFKESFDVIIFSLLLEYIPCSKLRYKCCLQSYLLLKYEGILIIITPDSKHQTSNNIKLIKNWKLILNNIGFKRIKYEKLKHLHCMIFRKQCLELNINNENLNMLSKQEINIPQDFNKVKNDFNGNVDDEGNEVINRENDEIIAEDFCLLPNVF